jgi:hypothetical protein
LWIIGVLAGLAVVFLFILWVPLDMVLHADTDGKPRFGLRLSWLFGMVRRELTGKEEKPPEIETPPEKTPARANKTRRWVNAGVMFKIIRIKGLLRHFKELVTDVLRCFRFRDIVADFKIGLGDPADTGLLFAVLGPATVFLGSSHLHRISIEPTFVDDAVLQGYSHGTVRLRPIRLVPPVFKFIFSTTTIKLAWTLIADKWKRKK